MECRDGCGRRRLDNRGSWGAMGMVRAEQSEGREPGDYNATANRGTRSITSDACGNGHE